MPSDFLVIAVTRSDFFIGESHRINEILSNGLADLIHIRKPQSSIVEVRNLLKGIDTQFHRLIKLHDHFSLLEEFELGGIHLNSRNSEIHPLAKRISKSVHSFLEIKSLDDLDLEYFFISPVFDSISKQGYKAAFDLKELSGHIKNKNAVALGGVTKARLPQLKKLGFLGAAMLSDFFPIDIMK